MKGFIAICIVVFGVGGSATADERAGTLRVALVQLASEKDGNFSAMLDVAQFAKAQGAEMIIYPETSDMGWLNPRVFYDTSPIPGAVTDKFAAIAIATHLWVAAGLSERGAQIGSNPNVYEAYDSAVLIDPAGAIILHHRKFNVLKNAFNECPLQYGSQGCSYTPGALADTRVAKTPFGVVGLLVCADAYTYDPSSLDALKPYAPDIVIVPWGVTAGSPDECGKSNFNATQYAAQAAAYLGSAYVVGANATGARPYGRFLPSWYCGTSGFAKPGGEIGGETDTQSPVAIFEISLTRK